MTAVNFARFSINDSPSEDEEGNRGYDASANETLAIALERPELGVLSVIFEVVRSSLYESTLVFTETGEQSVLLGGSGLPVDSVVHIEVPPTADLSSYLLRATVTTVVGVFVWERIVAVVKSGIRLTVPYESTQYSQRGWSDSLNQVAKAIADGGVITPVVSDSNVGVISSYPSGLRRIFHSDGSSPGGSWDVLTQTDIDAALAIQSINGTKLVNGTVDSPQLADGAVTTDKIATSAVSFTQMAQVATNTFLGRNAGGTGVVQAISVSEGHLVCRPSAGSLGSNAPSAMLIPVWTGTPVAEQVAIWDSASAIRSESSLARNASTGAWTVSSSLFVPTPTEDGHAATKEYADQLVSDAIADINSGSYTPSLSSLTGFSAATVQWARYMRIGSIIHVAVSVSVTYSTGPSKSFRLTLPVARSAGNFSSIYQAAGGGGAAWSAPTYGGGFVQAVNASQLVQFNIQSSQTASTGNVHMNFMYSVT